MNQDFFTNLPSSITIDILSRLPVRTIVRCKCVCKSWLELLQNHEFSKHHLSKSAPGLAVYQSHRLSDLYEIYEFEDEHDLEHHDLHYNLITNFKLPYRGLIQGSANGFIFLRDLSLSPNGLFICNPITREYIEIHCPQEFDYTFPQVVTFGFGASRITGQHKVVRVSHDCVRDQETYKLLGIPKSDCHVYTLESGAWRRSTTPGAAFEYNCRSIGAFLNGNLHWLIFDLNGKPWISCFDLETELFSIVSPPPPLPDQQTLLAGVFALGDCMCVCDNSSEDEIVVWLMKEYGIEKSWRKEFVVKKPDAEISSYDPYQVVCPIKVFEDGDILMAWGDFFLFYSPSKIRTIAEIQMFEARIGAIESILHTSSFLSLKTFGMEKVISF